MVLHYAEHPRDVLAEAARAVRPGGQLVVVDFAPHQHEELRSEHAHRRLGFADEEIARWLRAGGLTPGVSEHLPGERLTVCLWCARKPARPAAHALSDEKRIDEAQDRQQGYAA
jgi:ArsR family transcriptional regulator